MKSHPVLSNDTYKAFKEALEGSSILIPHLFFYVVKRLLTDVDFTSIKEEKDDVITADTVGELATKLSKYSPECEVTIDYRDNVLIVTENRFETKSEVYERCYHKVLHFLNVARCKRQNQLQIGDFERVSSLKEVIDYMIEHDLEN